MVLSVFAALVSCVCAEVEHIPDVCCPKVFSRIKLFNQFLVIIRLILFGIVALRRF